jgi:hypothetical protein
MNRRSGAQWCLSMHPPAGDRYQHTCRPLHVVQLYVGFSVLQLVTNLRKFGTRLLRTFGCPSMKKLGAARGVHRCEDAVDVTSRRHPDRQKHPRTAQVVGQDDAR